MKNENKESRRRALQNFEDALGELPPKYFDSAYAAEKGAAKGEKRGRTNKTGARRPAPAWLRPVAACLAVLLLGGLIVFSIPVVNNIISRRAPAELPGTDVAEADTTAEEEETEAPECAIGDKLFDVGFGPEISVNMLLSTTFNNGLISEEAAEQIKPGMTYVDVKEMDLCLVFPENISVKDTFAINNGKMLRIERKYTIHDFLELYNDQIEWLEPSPKGQKGLIWTKELIEAQEKFFEENPIENVIIYDDPEEWESFVKMRIAEVYTAVIGPGLPQDFTAEIILDKIMNSK